MIQDQPIDTGGNYEFLLGFHWPTALQISGVNSTETAQHSFFQGHLATDKPNLTSEQ